MTINPHDPIHAAAYAWWRNRRPVDWSEAQHLEHPRVNCAGDAERKLAMAVAKMVEATK